jgi:methylmalonyl-CoA mutase N-terminal domain/subunit
MAIQLIINHEWGLSKNQNPNQGAFIIDGKVGDAAAFGNFHDFHLA